MMAGGFARSFVWLCSSRKRSVGCLSFFTCNKVIQAIIRVGIAITACIQVGKSPHGVSNRSMLKYFYTQKKIPRSQTHTLKILQSDPMTIQNQPHQQNPSNPYPALSNRHDSHHFAVRPILSSKTPLCLNN